MTLTRELEDGIETVAVKLPALICVIKQNFEPQRAKIAGVISASKKEIKVCTMTDLGLSPENVGIKGSPTFVSKAFRNLPSHEAQKYQLGVSESVDLLKSKIIEFGASKNA